MRRSISGTPICPFTITRCRAALEAELAVIRSIGLAYDRVEHEAGIICIATAVVTAQGQAVGALSITSSTDRHGLDDLAGFAPELRATAAAIAGDAADWRFPELPRVQPAKEDAPCPV